MRPHLAIIIVSATIVLAANFTAEAESKSAIQDWRKEISAARNLAKKDPAAGISKLEALLEKARQSESPDAEFMALQELAIHYRLEGRVDEAIEAYKKIDKFPEFEPVEGQARAARPYAKGWIATLSCRQAPYEEGIAVYRQMIAEAEKGGPHPQYSQLSMHTSLARCLRDAGRSDEAITILRDVLKYRLIRVDRFKAHAALAIALADAKRIEESREVFMAALPLVEDRHRQDLSDPEVRSLTKKLRTREDKQYTDRLLNKIKDRARRHTQQIERELLRLVEDLTERDVFPKPLQ